MSQSITRQQQKSLPSSLMEEHMSSLLALSCSALLSTIGKHNSPTSSDNAQSPPSNFCGNLSSSRSTSSSSHLVYATDFGYIVHTANGGSYKASGYDGSGNYNFSQSSQQAIVNSYSIGHTYSCWYDASNPSNAVLVRDPGTGYYSL